MPAAHTSHGQVPVVDLTPSVASPVVMPHTPPGKVHVVDLTPSVASPVMMPAAHTSVYDDEGFPVDMTISSKASSIASTSQGEVPPPTATPAATCSTICDASLEPITPNPKRRKADAKLIRSEKKVMKPMLQQVGGGAVSKQVDTLPLQSLHLARTKGPKSRAELSGRVDVGGGVFARVHVLTLYEASWGQSLFGGMPRPSGIASLHRAGRSNKRLLCATRRGCLHRFVAWARPMATHKVMANPKWNELGAHRFVARCL